MAQHSVERNNTTRAGAAALGQPPSTVGNRAQARAGSKRRLAIEHRKQLFVVHFVHQRVHFIHYQRADQLRRAACSQGGGVGGGPLVGTTGWCCARVRAVLCVRVCAPVC